MVSLGPGQRDAPGFQQVGVVGQVQRQAGVLLDQQHADAVFLVDAAHDAEDLGHDQRRQAEGGLVQQQQLGPQHQRAADGQHLLLAAGQRAGLLVAPLLQDREAREHALHVLHHLGLVAAHVGAQAQVLLDRQAGEGAAPVGHVGHAHAHHGLGGLADQLLAVEQDAAAGLDHLAQRAQRGRLAGAVGAEDGGDVARPPARSRRRTAPASRRRTRTACSLPGA